MILLGWGAFLNSAILLKAYAGEEAGASAYLTKFEVFETLCATIRSEAITVNGR